MCHRLRIHEMDLKVMMCQSVSHSVKQRYLSKIEQWLAKPMSHYSTRKRPIVTWISLSIYSTISLSALNNNLHMHAYFNQIKLHLLPGSSHLPNHSLWHRTLTIPTLASFNNPSHSRRINHLSLSNLLWIINNNNPNSSLNSSSNSCRQTKWWTIIWKGHPKQSQSKTAVNPWVSKYSNKGQKNSTI